MTLDERIRKYVDKMPPAISGQEGRNACLAVACVLIWGWDLTIEQALPHMEEYSGRCSPPWTHKELMHKLLAAEKKPHREKPRGYLLNERDDGRERTAPVKSAVASEPKAKERKREEWAEV